jgi:GrpB-like predicted nucleotidyltransferase (UPF0157 family)
MLINVQPYQANWCEQFDATSSRLDQALGGLVREIEHIGSTSVPGLAAKPIIDIQISVNSLDLVPNLVEPFRQVGFVHRPNADPDRPPPWEVTDPAEWAKAYFRTPDGTEPRIHVHVRELGRRNHRYSLLFRDFLRSSAPAREAYGRFKLMLAHHVGAESGPGGTGAYLDLKGPILDLIALAAERWAIETGWNALPTDPR